jgi:hypothetical protein
MSALSATVGSWRDPSAAHVDKRVAAEHPVPGADGAGQAENEELPWILLSSCES